MSTTSRRENSVRLLLLRYSVELIYFMLLVIIRTRIHIRVIVDCWLVYLGDPYELRTRRLTVIHAPCSLHFLLQNLVTFPVIFPTFFVIFRAPTSCGFLCWQGPCFTKCLIFQLNLNETRLVIKAMLKTANSDFIIELSIRNLPLVYMSNALSGQIFWPQRIYLQNASISTISCTFNSHIFRVYIYTLFSAHHPIGVYYMGTGQARLGQSCCIKNSFK